MLRLPHHKFLRKEAGSERVPTYDSIPFRALQRQLSVSRMVKQKESDESLKGWPAIAKFLSQPVSTAQRWAGEGMTLTRID